MALTVKICGLKTPAALDAALEAGADLVGFVFFPPSPRHLGLEAARELGNRVKGRAGKVALTVDATDVTLADIVREIKPDMLQLHGQETPDRVVAVRTRFGLPVMKALPIADAARTCRRSAAMPMSPTGCSSTPARRRAATRPGGLGKPFDWHLLAGVNPGVPFMLSGGLDAGNVAEAIAITNAPGVDVSSGVERAPGVKDPAKIRAFIRAARATEEPLDLTKATIL